MGADGFHSAGPTLLIRLSTAVDILPKWATINEEGLAIFVDTEEESSPVENPDRTDGAPGLRTPFREPVLLAEALRGRTRTAPVHSSPPDPRYRIQGARWERLKMELARYPT